MWRLAQIRHEIGENELPGRPARHVIARSSGRGAYLAAHRPGSHLAALSSPIAAIGFVSV
jgi:hypothetical protein